VGSRSEAHLYLGSFPLLLTIVTTCQNVSGFEFRVSAALVNSVPSLNLLMTVIWLSDSHMAKFEAEAERCTVACTEKSTQQRHELRNKKSHYFFLRYNYILYSMKLYAWYYVYFKERTSFSIDTRLLNRVQRRTSASLHDATISSCSRKVVVDHMRMDQPRDTLLR
jgi:hypothetical protein